MNELPIRVTKSGLVATRIERPVADFYVMAARLLGEDSASLVRPILREGRRHVLERYPQIKKDLLQFHPELLHGV